MSEPLTPEEIQHVLEAANLIERLDSFGGMLQRNPGIVAITCWLMGFLLRELVIYSNIFAEWLKKFLRVDEIRKESKNDSKSDK